MSDEITLTQLAAEMAHLRQQLESVNQRLDMIYGAVTRLAEAQNASANTPVQGQPPKAAPAPPSGMQLTPEMMLAPGSMLDSLRQYAVSMGLDISPETVERLKSHSPGDEAKDE
jgi:hypothetical protein